VHQANRIFIVPRRRMNGPAARFAAQHPKAARRRRLGRRIFHPRVKHPISSRLRLYPVFLTCLSTNPQSGVLRQPGTIRICRFIASRIARGTPSIRGKPFYSVTFARNYKDKSGAWKTAGSFSGSDLLLLAKLADLAHTEAEELRRADGQADESAA
jgi:hypothetical protein